MALVPGPPPAQGPPGGIGDVIIASLTGIGSIYIRRLVAGGVLFVLLVLVIPVSVLVFIVTAIPYYVLAVLLDRPTGLVGVALGLGWLFGTLALIAQICVVAWRRSRLIRALVTLYTGTDEAPAPSSTSIRRDPSADSATLMTRVSAADSRHASPDGHRDDAP
jgi:hypothetical protein